ncbi:hypothetical protein [Fructobacillus durionis]|uniref:Uncharacterized protein n=1 Tax=Fructobacillus durionis TaxID=283737 RepID=A0A1I1FLQ2_9LACO|nr:hypothetical protein [Fructobacillus durionis]SFB99916.1 hypothetical protein SAMN05660453_0798 [Fructobacillus durionis]
MEKKPKKNNKSSIVLAYSSFILLLFTQNLAFLLGTVIFLVCMRLPERIVNITEFYKEFMFEVFHVSKYQDYENTEVNFNWMNYLLVVFLVLLFFFSKSWYFLLMILVPFFDQIFWLYKKRK